MEVIGSIYTEVSDRFQKGIIGGVSRCVKAEKHDLGVIMADVNVIGSLESKFESTNRIYDVGGCSPTLSTMQGGNQEPKILESIVCYAWQKDNLVMESQVLTPKRTEYGKQIRKAYESGKIQESRHNMTELEPRQDNISNTLTTVQKDNLLLESVLAVDEQNMNVRKETFGTLTTDGSSPKHNNRVMIKQSDIQKVGQISSNGSQCGTVISDNGISANLVAGTHGYANSHIATQYRIRKLTPRECGRLMGVSDEDIDKMAAVNSNTQLYKQFGNSIVVDVMCAMFKNLNIKQGDSQ